MFLDLNLSPKERVKKARTKLLREKPFFGYALMHVQIVSKDEPKRRGPKIVYSEDFVKTLDDDELMGVLCHELLHYLLGHTKRSKAMRKKVMAEKDRQYYRRMNIAEDVVVNAILVKNGFKLPDREVTVYTVNGLITLKVGAIIPETDYRSGRMFVRLTDAEGREYVVWDPDKKSVEEVYWEIRDFAVPEEGDGEDTMYFSDDEEDEDGGGDHGGGGFGNRKPPEELLSEAYTYAKMYGNAPAGFERLVEGALKPKIDWRAELRQYVAQLIPYDYSFLKPSRRSPPGIILPGIVKGEHLEGLVGIDTSGSITKEELNQFLSEVKWMARNFPSLDLTLVSCDAEIQTEEQIRSRYEVDKFKPKGGGGTNFCPVFELAMRRRAKLVIYFTDGWGEFPERAPKFPVIWVVSERGAPKSAFPFGKVIKMSA